MLVNRIATLDQRNEWLDKANFLPRVQLDQRSLSDLELIAVGGFSPLTGFMEQTDYEQVVTNMRLANGLLWSIPITLSVTPIRSFPPIKLIHLNHAGYFRRKGGELLSPFKPVILFTALMNTFKSAL
jgi:ATP sulfurylase